MAAEEVAAGAEEPARSQRLTKLNATPGIWANVVISSGGFTSAGRRLLKFEKGCCFVEEPGKNVDVIKPKHVERIDSLSLVVDSGFWNYGKIDMKFDSSGDADEAEKQLRRMLA